MVGEGILTTVIYCCSGDLPFESSDMIVRMTLGTEHGGLIPLAWGALRLVTCTNWGMKTIAGV